MNEEAERLLKEAREMLHERTAKEEKRDKLTEVAGITQALAAKKEEAPKPFLNADSVQFKVEWLMENEPKKEEVKEDQKPVVAKMASYTQTRQYECSNCGSWFEESDIRVTTAYYYGERCDMGDIGDDELVYYEDADSLVGNLENVWYCGGGCFHHDEPVPDMKVFFMCNTCEEEYETTGEAEDCCGSIDEDDDDD